MEKTYVTNSIETLDGWKHNRQRYTELVTEFLKTKPRRPYYKVSYYDDPETCNDVILLKSLTEENIAEINARLDAYIDEQYPEEACHKSEEIWRKDIISEVIDELRGTEYLENLNMMFEPMEVTDIDLYTKHYCYHIRVALFTNGMDASPEILDFILNLPDDVYIYLTAEFMTNPEFTFSKLRTKNADLYNTLCNDIEYKLHKGKDPADVPTYAVELTEIVNDAKQLLSSIEK